MANCSLRNMTAKMNVLTCSSINAQKKGSLTNHALVVQMQLQALCIHCQNLKPWAVKMVL